MFSFSQSSFSQEPMKPSMPCNGETEHSHVVVDLEDLANGTAKIG